MRHSVSIQDLAASVVAVPPLARTPDGAFCDTANRAIVQHMEQGGVTTIVYGGNALAHHWPMSLYADWLDRLEAVSAEQTWLMPSVGPDAGKLHDQAAVLKKRKFPVALLLPMAAPRTREGSVVALREFHRNSGVSLIIYIKTDAYMPAEDLALLVDEGVVFGVKYAVPRPLGADDPYLEAIIKAIGAERIISGFGEPPAIPHMLEYGLAGFTAGCVCLAPALSMGILRALQAGDRIKAEQLLQPMLPLETLREDINEIRVLHAAISGANLAETGPILTLSSPVGAQDYPRIAKAATRLLDDEIAYQTAMKNDHQPLW